MGDYIRRDDVARLLDEAEAKAEQGKYESAAMSYKNIGQRLLSTSAEHGTVTDSERAEALNNLNDRLTEDSGKSLYASVTDWFSGIRSDYDMILHPRPDGGGSEDGGRRGADRGYGHSSLDVSIDVRNIEDAEASADEPFEPHYSVSLTAMADSEDAARDYVAQTLADSDYIAVGGVSEEIGGGIGEVDMRGQYDISGKDLSDIEFLKRSRRQGGGDETFWTYEVEIPSIHAEVPWLIEEDGYYSLGAAFQTEEGDIVNHAEGRSDWFRVTDAGDDANYDDVSMEFDVSVPEDAAAGQVWNAQDRTGLARLLDAPSVFNRSVEPSYSLALRAGDEEDLQEAVNDLEHLQVRVARAEESDIGPAIAAGRNLYTDDETYTLAVEDVDTVYRQGGEWVVHFDGLEPEDEAPRFDEGGVRVVQAQALDADENAIEGMTSAPDFLEVDDWSREDAYDAAAEQAKTTWGAVENSYLFGGKQEKKTIGEASAERIKGSRVAKNIRAIVDDVVGDGIYHELVRPHFQRALGRG